MIRNAGLLLLAGILISLGIWWQIYRYQDCRAVGHTQWYCLLTIGK